MGSILLVETDSEISARLDTAGHSLLSSTMRDAAALLREGGIDVVVIDGHDHCRGVIDLARAIDALPDSPPIILISSSPVAPEISARIGTAAFLAKPCEPSELVSIVTRLLGKLHSIRTFEDEPTGRTQLG